MILRRSLSTLLLALLLVPGAALAQSRRSSPPSRAYTTASDATPPLRIGAYIGYESGDWDGLALRLDGELPIQRLAPNLMLSGVASIGFSHLTNSVSAVSPVFPFPRITVDSTVNRLDVIPAARFTFEANRQLSLYGDVGLGVFYAKLSSDFAGSDTDFAVKMRFGVGGFLALSPTLDLGAELALQPHFGSYDNTTFTVMAAARFRVQ
jgi:opacity protein-like surface antigen